MAYSYITYPGTGAQTDFAVTFPYIDADHVGVTVDGVSTSFSWVNDYTVSVSPAPALDAVVRISRDSSRAARLREFETSEVLTEEALNEAYLQTFYMAQESFDAVSEAPSGGDMRAVNNLSEVNPTAARANIGALASANPVITGNLTLDTAPSSALHATTKAYVDAAVAAVAPGSGETNTASNVGAGVDVFKAKSGVDLRFRTLVAGTGVVLTENADDIQIDATGVGGGEVNIGANINVSGEGLYTGKSGVSLQFKGVGANDGTLTETVSANDVLLSVNQAYAMVWTAKHGFTGGTAVPSITSGAHGIDTAGGALDQLSQKVTRTAPNAVGTAQVQVTSLIHTVTGTASTAWEWAQLVILDNYCTTAGTDQVGSYIKAYKRSGAQANHWGMAIEVANQASDKAASIYGMEIRLDTNGTETNGKSGPLALFYGSISAGNSYQDHGLLIEPSDNQTGARLGYGIRIEGRPDVAIAQGLQGGGYSGTSMIAAHGKYTGPVFDTAGNSGASCGLRLKAGQSLRLSGTESATKDLVWNTASNRAEFQYNGNLVFDVPIHTGGTKTYAFGMYTTAAANFTKTSPTDGAASPKNPVTYIRIMVDGNPYRLALYND